MIMTCALLFTINRMKPTRVLIFYVTNCIHRCFAVGVHNNHENNYYKFRIIVYITVKQCSESLPLVVMFTITFIHYMVVIFIQVVNGTDISHSWRSPWPLMCKVRKYIGQNISLANNGQRVYMYSRGNRPAHESTPPRQVVTCSRLHVAGWGFVYVLCNHELTVFIHCRIIAHAFHHYLSCHHFSYTLL